MRRLAMFVTQIEAGLTRYCREHKLPSGPVEEFGNETLALMMDSAEEFPTMDLLMMLSAPQCSNDVVRAYRKKLAAR